MITTYGTYPWLFVTQTEHIRGYLWHRRNISVVICDKNIP